MAELGVIGLGSVGWAVIHGLSHKYSYVGYDIAEDYDWEDLLDTNILFICVGTPGDLDGRLDCSQVESTLSRLSSDDYKGVVVVKSTVRLGFFDYAKEKFAQLRLVYMPEFLRERNSYTWFLDPDRFVIAGESNDIDTVMGYFTEYDGVEVIKTDFKTAELGKLAHNSYIATKVSFTNEIEDICGRVNADPVGVMHIVDSDRRVKSKEHLTPGLGPYGGKCVPKDVDELKAATNSEFFEAVKNVNSRCSILETRQNLPSTVVIIPTLCRMETLERTLHSVANQTLKPVKVIVIADSSDSRNGEVRKLLKSFPTLDTNFILNERAQNISGAINSGLYSLKEIGLDVNTLFVAFLDDDDWWDRKYLENCTKFAAETNSEWVVSGIIRYDSNFPKGQKLPIPSNLHVSDFLTGNPNVQNSNLFVSASGILSIKGFDEGLVSTTDRDVCIRLLQVSGIRYAILRNHLVHHDATRDEGRLSSPGSSIKRAGLQAFFTKYQSMMTGNQKYAFKDRARKLFDINMDEECC